MASNYSLIEEAAEELAVELEIHPWFFDTNVEDNSIVVYVDTMDEYVSSKVPDFYKGYQVKMGFTAYHIADEKYGEKSFREACEEFGVR